ncbi:MAG: DUF2062 domain-containing protein [Candidatus Omnitrophota bacterium]
MPDLGIKRRLLELVRSPHASHETAFGIAIGVFIGMTPLYGLHIWIALLFALILPDINKLALIIGANLAIPPFIPLITWINYEIGRFLLRGNCPPFTWATLRGLRYQDIPSVFFPLLLGSVFFGAFCAMVSYALTIRIVEHFRKRYA